MPSHSFVSRAMRDAMLVCVASLVETVRAAQPGKEDQVPVDLYQGPRRKAIDRPDCSKGIFQPKVCRLLRRGTEGRVVLVSWSTRAESPLRSR